MTLYSDLHSSRERLCRAQVYLEPDQRVLVGEAIDRIDRVGAFLPEWSNFDMPALGVETEAPRTIWLVGTVHARRLTFVAIAVFVVGSLFGSGPVGFLLGLVAGALFLWDWLLDVQLKGGYGAWFGQWRR